MRIRSIATAVAAVLVLGMARSSQAGLLAEETFTQDSIDNLQGQAGGIGWSGGWSVGVPGAGFLNMVRNGAPLNYAAYTGSTTPAASGGNFGNLAAGYGFGTYNWAQRQLNVTGAAFAPFYDGTRLGVDGTTLYGSFLYNNSAGGKLLLQGAGNQEFALPTTGSDSLYVFKLAFGTGDADTLSVFSNPTLPGFNINTATPSATFSGNFSFQTIGFITPANENEVRFDDIRLGTTVGDVIPVPEPTSIALLGMAVTGLAMRRRRRA